MKQQNNSKFPKLNSLIEIPIEKKENFEFVLADFHDFHKYEEIKTFSNITNLSLICENVNDISLIINNIPNPLNMKFLNLNQNSISNMNDLNKLENLEELHLNFNFIEKIENINNLKNLKRFWICDNKINKIENLPFNIESLWIAKNNITKVEYFNKNGNNCKKLSFLNLSGNFINEFNSILNISNIKNLEKLYLNDINFGDNPICSFKHYKSFVLKNIPTLKILDQFKINNSEISNANEYYLSKNKNCYNFYDRFYKNVKIIFNTLKKNKFMLYNLELYKFKSNDIITQFKEYINYINENKLNDKKLNFNDFEINDNYKNEYNNFNNVIKQLENNNLIYYNIKKYLKDLNDLNLVLSFFYNESCESLQIFPCYNFHKVLNLIKIKMDPEFFIKNNINKINIKKIFSFHNQEKNNIFNCIYEDLLFERKLIKKNQNFVDFKFLILPNYYNNLNYENIFDYLINKFEKSNLILINNFIYLDEKKILNNNNIQRNNFFMIICKTFNFEDLYEEIETEKIDSNNINDLKDIENIFRDYIDNFNKEKIKLQEELKKIEIEKKQNEENLKNKTEEKKEDKKEDKKEEKKEEKKEIIIKELKDILQFNVKDFNNTKFYNYLNNNFVIPQYIVEYSYDSIDYLKSTFDKKISLPLDYENFYNKASTNFFYLNQFFTVDDIENYSKLTIENLNSKLNNGFLFFAKNTIINYINKCFDFYNENSYNNFMKKIKTNLDIINNQENILFKNIKIEENYKNILLNLKEINLFNCKLNDDIFYNDFISKLKNENIILNNCDKISLSFNNLSKINFDYIFELMPNIKNINLSHNELYAYDIKNKKNLNLLNISFNNIDYKPIIDLKQFLGLNDYNFIYYGNPIPLKNFEENFVKSCLKFKHIPDSIKFDLNLTKDTKNFDFFYYTFSFNNKYRNFSNFFNYPFGLNINNSIYLCNKKLNKIPFIKNNNNLDSLYLNLNNIINIENLESLINLNELNLSFNKITEIKNLPINIKILNLSNNFLTSLEGLENNTKIEILNLENNKLKSFSEIFNLINLNTLNLYGNHLKNIKECCQLTKLYNLTNVKISNKFMNINSRDFYNLMMYYIKNLKYLNDEMVTNNKKIYIDKIEKIISSIFLQKLNLNFIYTKNLLEIDLSSLKLKQENNLFNNNNFPNLQKLNLSKNKFKSLSIFGELPNLIDLNLNFNYISSFLPEKIDLKSGVFGIQNVKYFQITNNGISNLNGINYIKNLEKLNINGNNLTKIDSLNNLNKLIYLDISNNKIAFLDKKSMPILNNLKKLFCDGNQLKKINNIKIFTNLTELSCKNNLIDNFFQLDELNTLQLLKNLNLINNPINKLENYRIKIIKNLSNLSILDEKEINEEEKNCELTNTKENLTLPPIKTKNVSLNLTSESNVSLNDDDNFDKKKNYKTKISLPSTLQKKNSIKKVFGNISQKK